jgi:hypothetical protein
MTTEKTEGMTDPITYTSDQLGNLYAQQVQDSEQVARWMGRALVAEFQRDAFNEAMMGLRALIRCDYWKETAYRHSTDLLFRSDAEWLTLCQEALAAQVRGQAK